MLADPESAPIDDKLRATLALLRKVTKEGAVTADDMRVVLATGVSKAQIEDALTVCFASTCSTGSPIRSSSTSARPRTSRQARAIC